MFLGHGFAHHHSAGFAWLQESLFVFGQDGGILFGINGAVEELEVGFAGKAELGDAVIILVEQVSPERQERMVWIGRAAEARPVDAGEIATAKGCGPCCTDEGAT